MSWKFNGNFFDPGYEKFKKRKQDIEEENTRNREAFADFVHEYMKYYNTEARYEEHIKDFSDYQRYKGRNSNKKKLKVIFTPPKKTIEEQRLRPKFRRKELGKITIWRTNELITERRWAELNSIYDKNGFKLKIEVDGEEGYGEVPQSLLKEISKNNIIVESINDFVGMDGSYYNYKARGRSSSPIKMNPRRFLYECIVHSQYIEFEDLPNGRNKNI